MLYGAGSDDVTSLGACLVCGDSLDEQKQII